MCTCVCKFVVLFALSALNPSIFLSLSLSNDRTCLSRFKEFFERRNIDCVHVHYDKSCVYCKQSRINLLRILGPRQPRLNATCTIGELLLDHVTDDEGRRDSHFENSICSARQTFASGSLIITLYLDRDLIQNVFPIVFLFFMTMCLIRDVSKFKIEAHLSAINSNKSRSSVSSINLARYK